MSKHYHIAVVGATGAVGVEMFRVLERRAFPVASIRAFGSKRSAGKSALFHDEKIPVTELAPESFRGIDLALFSATKKSQSRNWRLNRFEELISRSSVRAPLSQENLPQSRVMPARL